MDSWEDLAAMLPRGPNPLPKVSRAGPKGRKICWFKVGNWSVLGKELGKELLRLKERCGNVYENKGSAFHRRERSGNVIENKGTYSLKAGISLKTQHVRLLPTNSAQAGKDILALSPSSTFHPRLPPKASEVVAPVPVSPGASAEPVSHSLHSLFAAPYSLLWRFHLKRRRNLSSTPKIPFGSRTPRSETFSPIAHSNWMIWYCEEAVLVM